MTSLKAATKVNLGASAASRVYAGSSWAWPITVPTSIPGLAIWLDASKLNLANGAAVTKWPNLGASSQPTVFGSPAPTFRTNALNGLPVVRTTGDAGSYRFTGTGIDKDYTLVYVGRRWRLRAGRVVTAASGAGNVLWGFHGNEFDCAYVEGWFNTPGPVGGVTTTTQWKLYSGDHQATGTARLFSNGVFLGGHPSPPPTKGWGGTLNFGSYDDAHSQDSDFEIAEFVMYNRKLADGERAQVENYLRTKWNPIQPFTPLDLGSNLLGWFDGSDAATVQISGSGVSNWVNKSGGALTFTQGTDGSKPTYANQALTFVSPQRLQATNAPAAYDYIVVGKPLPPSAPEHRTLLRGVPSAQSHQMLLEPGNSKVAVWNGGFFPAGVDFPPPTMTSNSAPAPYVASAASEFTTGYEAFRAFDSNPSTFWHSAAGNPTSWVEIDLGTSRYVSVYRYQARGEGGPYHAWRDWVLDCSNDRSSWTRVDTVVNEPNFSGSEERTYVCDAPGSYRYWRWMSTATWGDGLYTEAAALRLFSSLTWDNVWGIGYGRISTTAPVTLSRDGGPLMSTGTTYAALETPVASLGGLPTGGQPWGDVREIIFIAYDVRDNIKPMLEGYLAHKWSMTNLLPVNHPYKTVAP